MSRDKIETFYLHFHKTCKGQTWRSGDLKVTGSHQQSSMTFDLAVTW